MTVFTDEKEKRRIAREKVAYRRSAEEEVRRRWAWELRHRCEGCDLYVVKVEVAHVFGSKGGHLIADWLASRPEMMMALCYAGTWGDRIGCHEEHDRSLNPDKRDRLRWHALTRLCAAESIPLSLLVDRTPEGAARAVEDWLKERERAG